MSIRGPKLKEGHKIAQCCSPQPDDYIIGYFSYNKVVVVHKISCGNLKKTASDRLFSLSWGDILEKKEDKPDKDYCQLDELDFRILRHHRVMGVDYSWTVAKTLNIETQEAFERHRKMKDLKLLKRVKKVMIQYRKNIVENKWIKHRNHTYYQITPRGKKYLDFFSAQKEKRR